MPKLTAEQIIERSGRTAAINYEPDSPGSEDGPWWVILHPVPGARRPKDRKTYEGGGKTMLAALRNGGYPV